VALLGAAALSGCGDEGGDAQADAPASARVDIASFEFVPDPIVVEAGGKLKFVNRDVAPHTAETERGAKGAFDSGRLDQGESRTIEFDVPGRFAYYCVYHRFMVGTVDVRK
jgi:plastocyanin